MFSLSSPAKNGQKPLSEKPFFYRLDDKSWSNVALALINIDKGTRPLRTPLYMAVNGVDREYVHAKDDVKAK
ncbi:hypothetical protein GCM10028807_50470 [Spirosoma daeguense]